MFSRAIAAASLLVISALPAQEEAKEKVQLRLAFEAGHVSHIVNHQNSVMDMNMQGQTMQIVSTMDFFSRFEVLSVEDDVATVQSTITRIKMQMANPAGAGVDYDSDDPDSEPGMLAAVAKLVGAEFRTRLNAGGKVLAFESSEEVEDLLDRAKVDMEQMLTQQILLLPTEPIAIGESWRTDLSMDLQDLGEMSIQLDNKLRAFDDNSYTVDQTLHIDLAGVELPNGMKMKLGETQAANTIDRRSGMSKAATMRMTMEIGGPDDPMQMTIRTQQEMKEYTPAPKKPAPVEAPNEAPEKAEEAGE